MIYGNQFIFHAGMNTRAPVLIYTLIMTFYEKKVNNVKLEYKDRNLDPLSVLSFLEIKMIRSSMNEHFANGNVRLKNLKPEIFDEP